MKTAKQLREERATKIEAMQAIHAKASAEKRSRTPEETTQWQALNAEVKALQEDLEIAERQEALDLEMAATRGQVVAGAVKGKDKSKVKDYSIVKVFRSMAENRPLEGFEREM